MGLGRRHLHTKFEVAGFIYFGNIRKFVFKRQIRFVSHPFGAVKGNVQTSSIAHWKAVVDVLFAIIELFAIALTVETFKQTLVEVGAFQKGWVTFSANYRYM